MNIEQPKTHSEAGEVLRRFKLELNETDPFKIARALLKAETNGMNNPGECETCRFISWDGELGTIQCCDKDVYEQIGVLEINDELFPIGECPLWESNAPARYCEKHKRWYSNSWELACPSCFDEYKNEA